MNTEQKSQLDRANAALVELSTSVTASDRQAAKDDNVASDPTIVQYLKGQGTRLDTAIKLLQFFRKRIEGREKVLA